MSRPGFLEGVLVAVILSIAGAVAASVLPALLGPAAALRLVVAALTAAYAVYLLRRSPERTGRVVVACLWLAASATAWALAPLPVFVLLQTALVWLVRILYHHGGPLAALADLGLSAFALAAAVWASGSGSWLLTFWSFFLTQALFPWIPAAAAADSSGESPDDRTFEQAREVAAAALRRLVTRP